MSSDDRWVGEEDPEAKLDDMIVPNSDKARLMQMLESCGVRMLLIENVKMSKGEFGFSVNITLVGPRENSRF